MQPVIQLDDTTDDGDFINGYITKHDDMCNGELSDGELANDKLSDNELTNDELLDNELTNDTDEAESSSNTRVI